MSINVTVLSESKENYLAAMIGMGLAFNKTAHCKSIDDLKRNSQLRSSMHQRAMKMAFKGKGHSKFLRAIHLDLLVEAPLDWWTQQATYTTTDAVQSTSTMHTLKRDGGVFDDNVDSVIMDRVNEMLDDPSISLDILKKSIPIGFIYTRTIHLNYQTLQHMFMQRHNHKLKEWRDFCEQIMEQIAHPYFIDPDYMKTIKVKVDLLRRSKGRISAIKEYHWSTGLSLRMAKDWCDERYSDGKFSDDYQEEN